MTGVQTCALPILAYKGIPAIEWNATYGMVIVSAVTLLIAFIWARLPGSDRSSHAGL